MRARGRWAAWPAAGALCAAAWFAAPGERPTVTDPAVTVISVRAPPPPTAAIPTPVIAVASATAALPFPDQPRDDVAQLPADLAALESAGTTEPPRGEDGAALTGP